MDKIFSFLFKQETNNKNASLNNNESNSESNSVKLDLNETYKLWQLLLKSFLHSIILDKQCDVLKELKMKLCDLEYELVKSWFIRKNRVYDIDDEHLKSQRFECITIFKDFLKNRMNPYYNTAFEIEYTQNNLKKWFDIYNTYPKVSSDSDTSFWNCRDIFDYPKDNQTNKNTKMRLIIVKCGFNIIKITQSLPLIMFMLYEIILSSSNSMINDIISKLKNLTSNNKIILVAGPSRSGKTQLICDLLKIKMSRELDLINNREITCYKFLDLNNVFIMDVASFDDVYNDVVTVTNMIIPTADMLIGMTKLETPRTINASQTYKLRNLNIPYIILFTYADIMYEQYYYLKQQKQDDAIKTFIDHCINVKKEYCSSFIDNTYIYSRLDLKCEEILTPEKIQMLILDFLKQHKLI